MEPIDAALERRVRDRRSERAHYRRARGGSTPTTPTAAPASLDQPPRRRDTLGSALPAPPTPPQHLERPAPLRSRAQLQQLRRPALALGVILLLVAAAVFLTGIARFPSLTDDEGTYVAQAWALRTRGALAHYTYWYDHPPLGWFQLTALTMLLKPVNLLFGAGASAVLDARRAMLVPFLADVVLVYLLCRRLGLRRLFAGLGTAGFAMCPLTIAMLREVLLDGLALPWILGAFVLAASPRRRLWSFAAAGSCAAIGVLSKETVLLVVPAIVLAVWQQCDRRTRSFCLTAFGVPFALITLGYPLFALLKGELLPGPGHVSLVEAVWYQIGGRASTGSPLTPGSGSRHVLDGWLSLDPWLLAFGLAALPIGLWIRRLRPIAIAFGVLALVALRPGYLPQPYVVALLPFAAVLAAGAADRVWPWVRHRLIARARQPARILAGAAVAVTVAGLFALAVHWTGQQRSRDAADANRPVVAATVWVEHHVDRRDRVLVDDTFFVDFAQAGFKPGLGVVWFYKLDTSTNLDPSVVHALPRGAAEFSYVVSTPVLRAALAQNPGRLAEVRRALSSSVVVARFGRDARSRVEVRWLPPPARPATRTDGAA